MTKPFDAVLLIAFGGPEKIADVRPFLANVLRGRRIPPERVEQVAHHYELFNGISPLNAITNRQAEGLAARLKQRGMDLPVYVGMRNWNPLLADTLEEMSKAGIRRAIGFIAAAHQSFSSCEQYRQNVIDARKELLARGRPDIAIAYVGSWYDRPSFIAANADHVQQALNQLAADGRSRARVVFTAHSIPLDMARTSRYPEQLVTTARLVAEMLGIDDWALVYQSRSGRPQDPWLEPDVCDYLREHAAKGLRAVVLAPIGFLCDHIEVLYDLDREAADACKELNIKMIRAQTVNDHPLFVDMMAEVVCEQCNRYGKYSLLPIAAPANPKNS